MSNNIARNRIQVMVNDETYEAVKAAAKDENRTVSDYVRVLLMEQHGTNK